MKNKSKTILVAIFVVLGIVAIATGVFLLVNNGNSGTKKTNRELFSESLKLDSDKLFKDDSQLSVEDLKFKLTTDNEITANGETGKITGELYYKNKEAYGKLDANGISKNYSIEAVLKDSKLYHKVKDAYSKFYYVDLSTMLKDLELDLGEFGSNELTEKDVEVLNKFVTYLSESLDDAINDAKIKEESKKVTLGGNELNVRSLSIDFSEKQLINVVKNLLNKIKNDSAFNELLGEFAESDINIDDIIKKLDESLAEATDDTVLTYTIYVDGDDILSYIFELTDKESSESLKVVINYYENKNGFNNFEIYLSSNGMKLISFDLVGLSKDKYEYTFNVMGGIIKATGEFESTDTSANLTLKLSMMNTATASTTELLNATISAKEIKKDSEYEMNITLDANIEDQKFNLTSKNKISLEDVEVPKVDLSGSADISQMTDEERKVLGLSNSTLA